MSDNRNVSDNIGEETTSSENFMDMVIDFIETLPVQPPEFPDLNSFM